MCYRRVIEEPMLQVYFRENLSVYSTALAPVEKMVSPSFTDRDDRGRGFQIAASVLRNLLPRFWVSKVFSR